MSKEQTARKMELLFHRVAAYRALVLSGYVLSASLALSYLILLFTEYKTPSPLYLLFLYSILPHLMRALLGQSVSPGQKKEDAMNHMFPLFCKKYHYSERNHQAANISYLIIFLLLCTWRYSYVLHPGSPSTVAGIPVIIAAGSLLIRILLSAGYRFYFCKNPIRAMK